MHAAAVPLIGDEPVFEVEEPEAGPWHDGLVEAQSRMPFLRSRQMQAEARGPLRVDVRQAPISCEIVEIRRLDEDFRGLTLGIFNACGVLAAERSWRGHEPPDETARAQ